MPRDFEVRKEVELAATPEQVWEAITTGPGNAAWFMPIDPPDSAAADAWDPPHRFLYRTPEAEDGSTQSFEYLIEARDGGSTVLRFVHSGFLSDDWDTEYDGMTRLGWDLYLHTLQLYFRYFAGRPATFVGAEGPPASTGPDAWPVLLRALGLHEHVEVGEHVRCTPDGADPIDGMVDYAGPAHLGVRTADALYRFHVRTPLGMPVAVGHHVYTEIDSIRAGRTWTSWLARIYG